MRADFMRPFSGRVGVSGDRRVSDGGPGEAGPGPFPARCAQLTPQFGIGQETLERPPQSARVARRDDQTRLPVDDEIAETADACRHYRPGVSHRLEAGNAETLAPGRASDNRSAGVEAL